MNRESDQSLNRQLLDQYLDDALGAQERSALERRLGEEMALSALLARMRNERAARFEVFASYRPTTAEARREALAMLASAHAPLGRIGIWAWRLSAVAAAGALVIAAFAAGRATAPEPAAPSTPVVAAAKPLPERPYTVVYWNSLGEPQVRQFANAPDVDAFVTDLQSRLGGEVASISPEDNAGLSQQGSF